ncbi:hypothetical protein [Mycolicibacterium fortuitum]|uniref:hypothetical protein n=1 Tax=Mycolicibacterium fortuitum TaxID=1766 RepID=UPI0007EBBEA9|nr:hypothetical protein [Mycolicibacterium fortuitum]OBG50179.1 hypothetical protein A5670_26415 [Mycolicibacterium fortuitum]
MTEIGAQLPQPDPRGILVFETLPADLRNAEDSTQAADFDRGKDRHWRAFTRAATAAERTLLAHIGFGVLPDDLKTRVSFPASGVRRRTWPQVDGTEADPPPYNPVSIWQGPTHE